MRKYEESHSWITFNVDFEKASCEFWIMLGECQSKCEHLARVPLRPNVAEELNRAYIAKGLLATTAIEGNPMTEDEIQKLLSGELKLPPSREYQGQEVSNIAQEFNSLLNIVAQKAQPIFSVERIKQINRQVLDKLNLYEGVIPGEIRQHEVSVALYRGAPAEDCEFLLDRLCKWLNSTKYFGQPDDPRALINAILKAILAHLYLAWIHPFGDGNGRTARLVEFQILISSGIPAPAAHLLSNHYNLTRTEYYRQLHAASKSGGDVLPFLFYAVQGFLDGLKKQLDIIREQVLDVVWESHVLDLFINATKVTDLRRRDLLQDLSRIDEPVRYEDITLISHRVAKHYANKTRKTLTRDLQELYSRELIVFENGGLKANKKMVLAFLPTRAAPPALRKGKKYSA